MAGITAQDVVEFARHLKLPEELALAVWQQESNSSDGTKVVASPKGARGPMQVIPKTFYEMLPTGKIDEPIDNMVAGLLYLKKQFERYGGDMLKAAQAYHSGSAGIHRPDGQLKTDGYVTTDAYAKKVLERAQKLRGVPTSSFAPSPDSPVFAEAPASIPVNTGFSPDSMVADVGDLSPLEGDYGDASGFEVNGADSVPFFAYNDTDRMIESIVDDVLNNG